MARPNSTIGVFSDLDLGSSNTVLSNFNWVGDSSSGSGDAVAYRQGNIVFHNNDLWRATSNNENAEPGTTQVGRQIAAGTLGPNTFPAPTASPWEIVNTGSPTTVSPTPPASPRTGDQWVNEVSCRTYRYNGTVWVQIAGLEIIVINTDLDGGGLFSATLQEYDGGTTPFGPIETELDGGPLP